MSVELDESRIQLIAKALADPRRYEILRRLASEEGGAACSDMRERFDISAATFSHHMKELETAGLVRSEKEGKFVRYFVESSVLRAWLARLRADLI